MSDSKTSAPTTIPLGLRHALETGECVLFIGAGIGGHLSDNSGRTAPNAQELANELAAQFEIETEGSSDLAKISQIIEIRKKGRKELLAFLQKRLAELVPDKDLQWLLGRRWKAIYTTNYDKGIERAYELNPKPTQYPKVASVTSELSSINPLLEIPIIHLHGSLFSSEEPQIIITEDDYALFRERRRMLFELLKHEFATSTILYIGYSHNDSNWKILVNELISEFSNSPRPTSYRIAPGTPSLDIEILKAKGIETISTVLSSFVQAVRIEVSEPPVYSKQKLGLEKVIPSEFIGAFEKNPVAVGRLTSSWVYVNQAPFQETSNIHNFLRGDRANWGAIAKRDFFERDVEEDIYDELLDFATSTSRKTKSLAVLGPAGYGITTLLMTVAARLIQDRGGRVFFHRHGTQFLEGDILYAASLFPNEKLFFVIDNASDFNSSITDCIYRLRDQNLSACFVLGDRLNEWRVGRGKLNAIEYLIEPLSDPEILRLLAFLKKNQELNELEKLTPDLRFAAIKQKHGKELLVTMKEATENKSFDAILEDEYMGISNDKARQTYLAVCCVSQHGALVRDGLLANMAGLSVEDMYKLTSDATEGVIVYECVDPITGAYVARARHRLIAQIVWERCGDSIQKETILQQALSALNLNYPADAEAFEQFIKSDRVVDSIRTLDGRIKFYETAIRKDPTNPYVLQHYARMLHRAGHAESALAQIEKALGLRPNGRVLFHTQGIILSKLTEETDSIEMARRRLAQAEQAFRHALKIYPRDEYSFGSLARLYLDWAKKVPGEAAEYLAKCEATISEGLQVVATKESLWLVSADVQSWVGNEPGRVRALEKAVQEHPTSVLPRYLLARAYRFSGQPSEAITILAPVIRENINEFRLCIEYALCLNALGEPYNKAVAVLGLGTTYGLSDSRFIATYGGMLFMDGKFTEASRVFAETGKRDFATSEANTIQFWPRNRDEISAPLELKGRVSGVKAGYAFIEVPGYPRFFCPSSRQQGAVLCEGMNVEFEVGFSARGAQASKPHEISDSDSVDQGMTLLA